MTTGFAPPAIPSVETGTPPREWSESVLASSPVRDTPAAFSETPARAHNPEKQLQEESQASKTLKRQVASHSLSGKEGPHVSLPSTELKGAQPSEHTGGVGALPGNLSESSVALLPDERRERMEEHRPVEPPRQRRDTIKPSAAAESDKTGEKENQTKVPQDVTFSSDKQASSESSNARLQSREASDAAATGPQVEPQEETSAVQSKEVLGEQRKATAVPTTAKDPDSKGPTMPDQGQSASQDILGGDKPKVEPARHVKEGYGGDYHPAVLHPPPPGASVAEYQSSVAAVQGVQDVPTTGTAHHATEGSERKPGIMTMVKGEMKILAGKVTGDEDKVAEGKRLVHGEA